jgi:hypothetical protein
VPCRIAAFIYEHRPAVAGSLKEVPTMKVSARAIAATLFLPMTILLFSGCGKKAVKAPEAESRMTQSITTTRPAPRELPATRPSTAAPGDQSSQLLALRGEDIPISEPPSLEFIEPSAEDKLVLRNIYFDFDRSIFSR